MSHIQNVKGHILGRKEKNVKERKKRRLPLVLRTRKGKLDPSPFEHLSLVADDRILSQSASILPLLLGRPVMRTTCAAAHRLDACPL